MIGTYEAAPDSAGRITVPLALRRRLGDDLVICRSLPPENHLLVYDPAGFDEFLRQLFPVEPVTAQSQGLKRLVSGSAHEVRLDKAGRVLVPPRLRERAGIDGAVVVLGMGDHLEIWSAERYQQWEQDADGEVAAAEFTAKREEIERDSRLRLGAA
ncbi:MAG: hypothetical protein HZB16_07315 [Armatimonadetes bacterium]|nr:hypothetical protein [Armatimonadota bacterium]